MCDFFKNSEELISTNEKTENYNEYTEYENTENIFSDSQDENSEDDIFSKEINKKNNLPFTKILKLMKSIKLDTDYKKWIHANSEHVRDAYYIIQNKYLNDININNISLDEFSIFCFLSN